MGITLFLIPLPSFVLLAGFSSASLGIVIRRRGVYSLLLNKQRVRNRKIVIKDMINKNIYRWKKINSKKNFFEKKEEEWKAIVSTSKLSWIYNVENISTIFKENANSIEIKYVSKAKIRSIHRVSSSIKNK